MATLRKYIDAAKHRREKRKANGTKKVVTVYRGAEPAKRHQLV